ncbi:MAG TPA: hypothetical protein VGC41_20825, partial [Kofleriaceae bacterium]
GTLAIASLDPGATMTVTATVSLADGVTDAIAGDFTAMLSGENACDPFTMALPIRLNVDDVPSESTTDSFDAATSVWTADPAGWVHIRPTALDGKWHIDDFGTFGEWTIESPMLKSNGNMTMTFMHTYDFEPTYDGGNIEIELEGSTDWKDITAYANDPGYGPALVGDGPLANSPAFSGQNPSFPNADTVKVDFSDKLSGKSFKVRFHAASDEASGASGWTVDNVAFTGIAGKPFPIQVPNECGHYSDDDGCCSAAPLRTTSALLSIGVLGIVLRRRRSQR